MALPYYDCKEKRGGGHASTWQKMPWVFKQFVKVSIDCIIKQIKLSNPGLEFKVTSGWRSYNGNIAVGGSAGSSHLFGLAVDIVCGRLPLMPPGYRVLVSKGCYHIERCN